jgi:hypothetical protein
LHFASQEDFFPSFTKTSRFLPFPTRTVNGFLVLPFQKLLTHFHNIISSTKKTSQIPFAITSTYFPQPVNNSALIDQKKVFKSEKYFSVLFGTMLSFPVHDDPPGYFMPPISFQPGR